MSNVNIPAILADTKNHGFMWLTETVHRDGVPYTAEVVRVLDVEKFNATFPGAVLKSLNGTSLRVDPCQRICRNAGGVQKAEVLHERIVKALLGIKDKIVEKTVFVGPEGKTFATQAEAENAWLEHLQTA